MGDFAHDQDWRVLVAAKKESQQSAIPPEWLIDSKVLHELKQCPGGRLLETSPAKKSTILTDEELEITERYSTTDLLEKLGKGELTSVAVTRAFCKRAAVAQQLTSCLTEIFFEKAIERAEELDNYLKQNNKPMGPLHGLPISCKDTFRVKGFHATGGFLTNLKEPAAESNSALIDILLDAGAVLYAKTNVPQTLMTADSENHIFGRTLNPHNLNLTAGGSSGGEGSLVAFRGCPLGIGTDIAGSIRIPAMCCGVYGFKPTANRLPYAGQTNPPGLIRVPGSIEPSAGPLGHSVQDLRVAMAAMMQLRPWLYDADAYDIPWRDPLPLEDAAAKPDGLGRKLTIGILPEDPAYPLHPPVRRAVQTAAAKLEKAGHRIVWLPPDADREVGLGMRIAFQFFGVGWEGGVPQLAEPPVASVAVGSHPFSKDPPPVPRDPSPIRLLGKLHAARGAFADAWRRAWKENGLDVVLAPGALSPAVPLDTYGLPTYTVMWNLLDFPVCLIPFGKVAKSLDPTPVKALSAFVPDYDPEALDGAPVGIQIVAPHLRDEECLQAAQLIDRDIRSSVPERER